MDVSAGNTVFRISDLPVELIVEIALWAQVIWREENFPAHDPYAYVKRQHTGAERVVVRREPCCRAINQSLVPRCVTLSTLATAPTPAHSMSQLGRRLRSILIGTSSRVWKLDNTFYRTIAERSGLERLPATPNTSTTVKYGSRTLVATNVCSCFIRGIKPFYSTLTRVKLALPWSAPDNNPAGSAEDVIVKLNNTGSTLEHFDLEIYQSPLTPPRPVFRGILCSSIQTA